MKTYEDLANLVAEKESELAHGSETILLTYFVDAFGLVDDLIGNKSELKTEDTICDSSDKLFDFWAESYDRLEKYNGMTEEERDDIDNFHSDPITYIFDYIGNRK